MVLILIYQTGILPISGSGGLLFSTGSGKSTSLAALFFGRPRLFPGFTEKLSINKWFTHYNHLIHTDLSKSILRLNVEISYYEYEINVDLLLTGYTKIHVVLDIDIL